MDFHFGITEDVIDTRYIFRLTDTMRKREDKVESR